MSDKTSIEWTDASWNPVRGCSRVSEGCRNCYAEVLAARFSGPGMWGEGLAAMVKTPDGKTDHRWTGKVEPAPHHVLTKPLRWRKPRRIFVNSTSDLCHEDVPDEAIDMVFAIMALSPQHTFQILTKRPERMRAYVSRCDDQWHGASDSFADRFNGAMDWNYAWINDIDDMQWPLPNVWLGTSVEDQPTADERIPHLLATPAAVRFVSAEPLLTGVDLVPYLYIVTHADNAILAASPDGVTPTLGYHDPATTDPRDIAQPRLDWVIVGGESGPGARPMHPDWARSLRDQCAAADVAFHFKQWGEWAPEDAIAFPNDEDRYETLMTVPYGEFHGGADWIESCACAEGDEGAALYRVGKRRAGRLLDGVEHNGMPEVTG